MDIRKVIIKPLITEKANLLREKENKYFFKVDESATKGQVKQAIESLFKVKVEKVFTSIVPGKLRRLGANAGYKSDWKKAVVKIKKGQEIKMIEDV